MKMLLLISFILMMNVNQGFLWFPVFWWTIFIQKSNLNEISKNAPFIMILFLICICFLVQYQIHPMRFCMLPRSRRKSKGMRKWMKMMMKMEGEDQGKDKSQFKINDRTVHQEKIDTFASLLVVWSAGKKVKEKNQLLVSGCLKEKK